MHMVGGGMPPNMVVAARDVSSSAAMTVVTARDDGGDQICWQCNSRDGGHTTQQPRKGEAHDESSRKPI